MERKWTSRLLKNVTWLIGRLHGAYVHTHIHNVITVFAWDGEFLRRDDDEARWHTHTRECQMLTRALASLVSLRKCDLWRRR